MLGCREEAAIGESIWHQRDEAEDMAALQANVLSLQHGPSCLSGGLHALREHHAHWEAHAGEPRARGHQPPNSPAAQQRSPK